MSLLKNPLGYVSMTTLFKVLIKIEFTPNTGKSLVLHENNTVVDKQKAQFQELDPGVFF